MPRCLELVSIYGSVCVFREITPPCLLLACKESKDEVIQAYKPYHDAVSDVGTRHSTHARWSRFDKDIFHLKPWRDCSILLSGLSQIYTKPGHALPIQQHSGRNSQVNMSTDKWHARPKYFDKIKYLAVSRDCECFMIIFTL